VDLEDAERRLLSRETFGVRLGLDRMRRLLAALGDPQERLRAIHVVGTNGKSSTVRMTAALLQRHGLRAGAYLSPHLVSFAERVRIDDRDVAGEDLAAALQRAFEAAEAIEPQLEPGEHVTQFEALTAAAFDLLARADLDVAVIEAGLGGRLDATNVLPSRVQVLTNVGLEHTRFLGPTVQAIAEQKLAVVRPGGTLVVGPGLHPDAAKVAAEVAERRGARLVHAPAEPPLPAGVTLAARGPFQRRNLALAAEAARAFLGRDLDDGAVAHVAASTTVPGRFEVVDAPGGEAPPWPRRCRRSSPGAGSSPASPSCRTRTPPRCSATCCRWPAPWSARRPALLGSCRPRPWPRPRGRPATTASSRSSRSSTTRVGRWPGPGPSPAPAVSRWPPAPSISSPSSCGRPTARGARCERGRPAPRAADRRRGDRRRAGDPDLLRRRLRLRPAVPLRADRSENPKQDPRSALRIPRWAPRRGALNP
jgi:hypothetical protein